VYLSVSPSLYLSVQLDVFLYDYLDEANVYYLFQTDRWTGIHRDRWMTGQTEEQTDTGTKKQIGQIDRWASKKQTDLGIEKGRAD
jgi:hypothetical protein